MIIQTDLRKSYYFLLEKGMALHLNKLESPSPKDGLCQVGWIWPSGFKDNVRQAWSEKLSVAFDQLR